MPTIDRGTHRLHYQVQGPADRPAILMIMGFTFSSRAWHTLPARLESRFRVIRFDNAGVGQSTAPASELRLSGMADDAAAVLDALGLARAHVFGISMGGMIAIELALRHPARIDRLALGATMGGYWRSRKPDLRTAAALLVAPMLRGHGSAARLARFLVSEAHYAADPAGFARWLAVTDPAPQRIALRQLAAILRHDADDRLQQIRIPTLILSGDRDRLVPIENSRRLARAIPGARLLELAGVGHCFPVEQPEAVATALEQFFLER